MSEPFPFPEADAQNCLRQQKYNRLYKILYSLARYACESYRYNNFYYFYDDIISEVAEDIFLAVTRRYDLNNKTNSKLYSFALASAYNALNSRKRIYETRKYDLPVRVALPYDAPIFKSSRSPNFIYKPPTDNTDIIENFRRLLKKHPLQNYIIQSHFEWMLDEYDNKRLSAKDFIEILYEQYE